MRIADEGDLPAIVSIYNSTIPTRQSTADTVAVTVDSRREWFSRHDPATRPLMVHEQNNRIVAWISFQSFYGRPAYENTVEISIYIAPACRGQGLVGPAGRGPGPGAATGHQDGDAIEYEASRERRKGFLKFFRRHIGGAGESAA